MRAPTLSTKVVLVGTVSRSTDLGDPFPRRTMRRRLRRRVLRGRRSIRDGWEMRRDPTYRRLAADYRLPDGSTRVYCYHVRKTAGTSLYLSFMALGGEDPMEVWRRINGARLPRTISGPYSYASNSRRLLAEGAYFFGRSHRPAAHQPLPPRTFTVTVLRDPIDRVRSYYDYLVTGDLATTPGRVANRERRIAADGFDAFLDRVPQADLLNQLAMFSTRFDVSEATDRIAACSSVFFTETFASGLAVLGRQLELPLEVHRSRVGQQRTTLTDGQRERLRTRLEPEYELLRRLDAGGIAHPGPNPPG
jgi:hypothetical protein